MNSRMQLRESENQERQKNWQRHQTQNFDQSGETDKRFPCHVHSQNTFQPRCSVWRCYFELLISFRSLSMLYRDVFVIADFGRPIEARAFDLFPSKIFIVLFVPSHGLSQTACLIAQNFRTFWWRHVLSCRTTNNRTAQSKKNESENQQQNESHTKSI